MKISRQFLWFLLALIIATGATTLLLSYIVTNPGNTINELGGDTGKNYFTFIYHAVFGQGVWFDGMNYPYGEHIIYADGQPILSTFLHLFQPINPHQALAVMNLMIAFSYVLAILFTWKTLLHFQLKPGLAILFACLIIFLDPQVIRVRSHFGLSYACNIPMLFYWSLLYFESSKLKYPVYIFIMGAIMSLLHLYQGAIIFIWVAFYALGYILLTKSPLRSRFRHLLPMIICAASLFLYIKIFITITDPITDRPGFPLNTLESVTHIRDIFASPYSPIWTTLHKLTGFSRISDAGEGYTYLGVAAIAIILSSVFMGIAGLFLKKKDSGPKSQGPAFPRLWLFMAIGALLLAMGAPFIWNLHWLLNYLSLFKQFRAMGRFSWVFYYIMTVYAVVAVYGWYIAQLVNGKRILANAMLIAVLLTWSADTAGIINYTRGFIAIGRPTADAFFNKYTLTWPQYIESKNYKPTDFQAIILLPLFISGSEKLWVGGDPSWSMSYGISAATQMHLPIVDVQMSRTSWSVTEKQVKTIAGPYAAKPMLYDLKSDKPLLLVHFDCLPLSPDEQYLLSACDSIGHEFRCFLYAFYPARLKAMDKKNADRIASIAANMQCNDSSLTNTGPWYLDHFDNLHASENFFGAGAMPLISHEDSIITLIPFTPAYDNQPYEFSCWFLLDDKDYRSPYMNLKLFDSLGKEVSFVDALTTASVDNSKMWFRASVYLNISSRVRTIKFILNNRPNPSYKVMDEMLLRPADAVIISKAKDGKILVNNHELIGNQ